MENNINIITSSKKNNVTVGMPVWNGEKHIRTSIESILNQDYLDFQLIISDNASTDFTQDICNEYIKQDKRIIYTKNAENIGAGNNYTKVVNLAEGSKYFMWAANDDIWDPYFISKTKNELEMNDNATLCCTEVNFVDINGLDIEEMKKIPASLGIDNRGMSIFEKYKDLMVKSCWCILYGLYRYEAVKKTMPFPNAYSGDLIFLFNFLFTGDIIKLDEPLFHYRFRDRTTEDYLLDMLPKDLIAQQKKIFTKASQEMLKNILNSSLSLDEKVKLQQTFIDSINEVEYWRKLLLHENKENNVTNNVKHLIKGSLYSNDILKDLIKGISNNQEIVNDNKSFNVASIDELSNYYSKINELIEKKDFSLVIFTINGLINEFGKNIDILLLKAKFYHEKSDYYTTDSIINELIDEIDSQEDIFKLISFTRKKLYLPSMLEKLVIKSKNYDYPPFVDLFIDLDNESELKRIYLSPIYKDELSLNKLKNYFLKNELRNDLFQNKVGFRLSILIEINSDISLQTLTGLINGNFEDKEFMVICSNEYKSIIINKFGSLNNIHLIDKTFNLVNDLNTSIKLSSGKYISVFNGSISYNIDNLTKILNRFDLLEENFVALYSDISLITQDDQIKILKTYSKWLLLNENYLFDYSIFFRRDVFNIYGLFEKKEIDLFIYEFVLRISQTHLLKYIDLNIGHIDKINQQNLLKYGEIRNQYLSSFKNSKLINKPVYNNLTPINFGDIDFDILHEIPDKIDSFKNFYLIFFDKYNLNLINKESYSRFNSMFDQIWVSSKTNYNQYISLGIDSSKLKIVEISYSQSSLKTIYDYIKELENTPITRFNINIFKSNLKTSALEDFENQNYVSSEKKFDKLLKYDPSNYESLYYVGLAQFYQYKYEDCIENLSTCLELGLSSKEILEIIGISLEKIGDHEMSIAFYEKANTFS